MIELLNFIYQLIGMYEFIVIAAVIMSWLIGFGIINPYNQIARAIWNFLQTVTEPALRPIRAMLPDFGGGLGRFLFEPNTVSTRHLIENQITRALIDWEPRIRVESVKVEADPADNRAREELARLAAEQQAVMAQFRM